MVASIFRISECLCFQWARASTCQACQGPGFVVCTRFCVGRFIIKPEKVNPWMACSWADLDQAYFLRRSRRSAGAWMAVLDPKFDTSRGISSECSCIHAHGW